MPELPEIETIKESIEHEITGCNILDLQIYVDRLRNMLDKKLLHKLLVLRL